MPLSYTSFLNTSPNLDICTFQLSFKCSFFTKSWLSANRQRFQILHPTISLSHKQFLFWKFLWRHCKWFVVWVLPPIKTLASPRNWRMREKLFWRPFFFWEHLQLCPWSLALASSIPVFELERVCPRKDCPRPWPRIFCVLDLGFEPCVLDSTFGVLIWLVRDLNLKTPTPETNALPRTRPTRTENCFNFACEILVDWKNMEHNLWNLLSTRRENKFKKFVNNFRMFYFYVTSWQLFLGRAIFYSAMVK